MSRVSRAIKIGTAIVCATAVMGCAVTEERMQAVEAAAAAAASDAAAANSAAQSAAAAANSAQQAASAAQNTAQQAMSAAQAAQSCCEANSQKIDRMFQKSMSK